MQSMRQAVALGVVAVSVFGQENLLRNGTFDKAVSEWSQWFAPGRAQGEGTWAPRDEGGAMHVTVARTDRLSSVQIYQGPFAVKAGTWYEIGFEARADRPTSMVLALMRNSPPYGELGLRSEVNVGTAWQRMSFLARCSHDSEDARLDLFLRGSVWLDNVFVRVLGDMPPTVPIREITLGRGFRGNPSTLTDGDPDTGINAGYYPTLPLFVTLDLGEQQPVGAVVVQSVDHSRHLYIQRLECEASIDGTVWRRWAEASKSVDGNINRRRQSVFTASGIGVVARYLRLRVTQMKGIAPLHQVEVYRADGAEEGTLEALPVVSPEEALAFAGWDYERNAYVLSYGETVELAFANQSSSDVQTRARWRLETYAGDELSIGEAPLAVPGNGTGRIEVDAAADLDPGPYRLRYTVGESAETGAFFFEVDRGCPDQPLALALGAYFDSQAPEGWVRLIAGPLAPYVSVYRRIPTGVSLDAVVASCRGWAAEDPKVRELREYVANGGLVVFFGDVCEAFDDLLPVEIQRDSVWDDEPAVLGRAAFWPTFDAGECPPQYRVPIKARDNVSILATWTDGMPAVVSWNAGGGTVAYVAAASGRVWQRRSSFGGDELAFRLIYRLLGREHADDVLESVVAAQAGGPGVTSGQGVSARNIGRFGWLLEEAGLVEDVTGAGQLQCMASPSPVTVTAPDAGDLTGRVSELNWFAKSVAWRDGAGKDVLRTTVSLGIPYTLWEGQVSRVRLDGPADAMVCMSGGTTRVLAAGDSIEGVALSEPWLIFVRAGEDIRDCPRVVVLSRRPSVVMVTETGVEVTYAQAAGGFGALWAGRLFGIRRLAPGATADWLTSCPEQAVFQARDAAGWCAAFPVGCKETFEVDGTRVTIRDRFEHRVIESDWPVEGVVRAPLPPVLSLFRSGSAVAPDIEGEIIDSGVATKCGPLEYITGNELTYTLHMPANRHYGVIPVRGRTELRDVIDFHGLKCLDVGRRAPGGLVSSGASYLSDLREYMSSPQFEDPFSAPCLDLYKWWYCFPTVLGRPAFGSAARESIDAHYRRQFRTTLAYYPYKALVRHRREPFSGIDYTVSFIWPVGWRDGVRYFVDQNESAAVIAYCLWSYAQYYGDWSSVESNWNLVKWLTDYLPRVHDWAFMCSSNQEYFSTAGIDMLNSEFPGNLAFARLARLVGDRPAEDLGMYLAAKAIVPTVARLFMPEYVKSITAPGDDWRRGRFYYSLRDTGFSANESVVMRGDSSSILRLGIGFLDTSKGTGPEICALYKACAPEQMEVYQRELREAENDFSEEVGWAHLMMRAFLGWPRQELIDTARRGYERTGGLGWQSTKYPQSLAAVCAAESGVHLIEWAPMAYLDGEFDPDSHRISLLFRKSDARPASLLIASPFLPQSVAVDGAGTLDWQYDPKAGVVYVRVSGAGLRQVSVLLGETRQGAASIYDPASGR